ncbi:MAG TPA: CehA/McbA family metallohydrolase [Acidobacteriota bacterium]|nr:CehA/McbA family metallohydrolase [Acidobacteriota bacterium]
MRSRARCGLTLMIAFSIAISGGIPTASAQWTNRYPQLAGYSHHIYAEGYELPLVTRGPVDAVQSPLDDRIVFSSRGWLWMLDGGTASRLTAGSTFDSRPAWSPDGERIAFVRDDTRDTSIWELALATGELRPLVETPALDLDPAYTSDGAGLLYSSAASGDLDIWRLALSSGESDRLTEEAGLELRPQPHGNRFLYLAKTREGADAIRIGGSGSARPIWAERIASQTRPALSPDGRTVALGVPAAEGWRLELVDTRQPDAPIGLTGNGRLPITPSWTRDGGAVLFSEADSGQTMRLYSLRRGGGDPVEVEIDEWDWGAPTGRLRVRTRLAGGHGFAAARLNVRSPDGRGHVPETGLVRFDGQNGMTYFYSSGEIEIEMPAGPARITAVQGLATPPGVLEVTVAADQTTVAELELEPLWDAAAAGWFSGDHHFHLNYGGAYRLRPQDLVAPGRGEAIDVLTPLTANLHNRFEDLQWWGWARPRSPLIAFGQEIRSHFLGHVGLLGGHEMFWPWIWGPGYQVYGADDRPNADPLQHGRAQGAVGYYVHPVSTGNPFGRGGLGQIPVDIIPDALAGDLDALEVACLWSDEVGTSELWYRFLNLGIPVAPSAGTDVMTNLYRTMAVGTTRLYVDTGQRPDLTSYLAGLRAGRSFVTTGPMLLLRVGAPSVGPGGVTPTGRTPFEIDLYSAVAVDRTELMINGTVVWSEAGLSEPGAAHYSGEIDLPVGGWIAARTLGSSSGGDGNAWPTMGSYPFAHTGPVWIDERGSTEPVSRAAAADDLLRALEVATARLERAYAGTPIPRLRQRFEEARQKLVALAE